ncbi:hypothetical protein ABGB07_03330 [Micromonosporaceae bacterium B7E4]
MSKDVGRSRKWTKQKRALALLAGVVGAFVLACNELVLTHYANATSFFLIVIGFVIWLVMTQVETRCGALRAGRRAYCNQPIRGLFFGCSDHTWQRPLAFFGIGNKRLTPRPAPRAPQPSTQVGAASAAIPALIPGEREHRRSATLFWVAIGSLVVGSLSSFTDVFGFVKDL